MLRLLVLPLFIAIFIFLGARLSEILYRGEGTLTCIVILQFLLPGSAGAQVMPCLLVKWTPLLVFLVSVGRSLCLATTGIAFLILGKKNWNRKDFLVVRFAVSLTLEGLLMFLF